MDLHKHFESDWPRRRGRIDSKQRYYVIRITHDRFESLRLGKTMESAALFRLVTLLILIWPLAVRAEVDFDTDIRPILTSKCLHCHGPDAESRASELRLDSFADATSDRAGSRAIVPGRPDLSELVTRITSSDETLRMPPADSKQSLTEKEIELLTAWIREGAKWSRHWSLQPLTAPAIPAVPAEYRGHVRNGIDHFVLNRMLEKQFTPSPEADRRTLIRRVTFDLTGLPPTPEDIAEFLADNSDDAYERLVDRLLASPRYGERWARHWMDAVHYADTHGHDEDAIRENAWPYRDYLIESFNSDKAYARFVQEQIAGDVLFPHSGEGVVAIGMLAAGPWDESSQMGIQDGTVDKEIARYLDRDDMLATVMNTFVSMTVHCARCHHHKFDPIPTEDYYSLQAVFAGVDRVDRPYDRDPLTAARRRELLAEKAALAARDSGDTSWLTPEVQARVAEWERNRPVSEWRIVEPSTISSSGGAEFRKNEDGSVLFSGTRPETDTYTITTYVNADRITAVRLEVLPDDSLSKRGPGRQDNGNLHLSEFKLLMKTDNGELRPVPLQNPVADFDQSGWTISHALDGNPRTAWGIYPQVGQAHQAVFELKEALEPGGELELTFVLEQLHGGGHLIGRPRLSITSASHPGRLASDAVIPPAVESVLAVDSTIRSPMQQAMLARFVLQRQNASALAQLPPQEVVYAVASEFEQRGNFVPARHPRQVHVLRRGNVLDPIEPAVPGALSCVEGLDSQFDAIDVSDEGRRRAALARWVSSTGNPLTWRSIVNRVWYHHFGRGIAGTLNDFGRNGSPPSHPDLLNWLAASFRDGGGSLKQLHRLIVTSATYRQSSEHHAAYASRDGDNVLLWRMNRRRLDAESTRDAILQMSGMADWSMGGPPARQFVLSKGVHVTPTVKYEDFDIDSPDARRRSVYRFIFRTVPDPFMEALDCPDASQFTPRRSSSMTSLQALAMLNSRYVVRYSAHIASRLSAETSDRDQQIRRLFEMAYARVPNERESTAFSRFIEQHGLANACRIIVNSNEFMFVD